MGRVALRLGEDLLVAVDGLCVSEDRDRSQVVRLLLREALAARGIVEPLVPDVKRRAKVTAPIVPPDPAEGFVPAADSLGSFEPVGAHTEYGTVVFGPPTVVDKVVPALTEQKPAAAYLRVEPRRPIPKPESSKRDMRAWTPPPVPGDLDTA